MALLDRCVADTRSELSGPFIPISNCDRWFWQQQAQPVRRMLLQLAWWLDGQWSIRYYQQQLPCRASHRV
ncbi:MAG: hypothetical protein AAF704_07270 [Cyanobacteria bacterium P01_D01_bin.123]